MAHVVQISFFVDPQARSPARILEEWWPLVDAAEMAAQSGMRVSVIQACGVTETVTRNAVTYHFLAPERGRSSISDAPAFAERVRALQADVFHVHGFGFALDVLALAALAPDTPVFLQDHADRVPRFWRQRIYRRGLAAAAGVSFCALSQAAPFTRAGILRAPTAIYEIPECSSRFMPADQLGARDAVGLEGDPAVLWVGHLDSNKDPLTVLDGIALAAEHLPGLQLWCCFGTAPLLPGVRARIAGDPRLTGRVHLLGKRSHADIEQLMRAADLFVLGSHREGSGCSLIEALACGLPPVVTDIPSFRMLTGGGRIGALWPCGDERKLCEALLEVAAQPRRELRAAVRAHFEVELSLAAVGRKLVDTYADVIECKRRSRVIDESAAAHSRT